MGASRRTNRKDCCGHQSRLLKDGDRRRPRLRLYGRSGRGAIEHPTHQRHRWTQERIASASGVYFIAPLLYVYNTDEVKDSDGNGLSFAADLTSHMYGGGISVVTKRKLLGGSYGFQVVFPVGANNRMQGTEIDANPGAGLTDSVITPINSDGT
jgi:hypothetical protein